MNTKKYEFSEDERNEIIKELAGTHPAHVYKRLMVLRMKAIGGMRSDDVGKAVGMYTSSVNRIINRYKKEGMEAIVGKRHNHGNRYMTDEEETAFLEQFREQGEEGKVIEVTDIHNAFQKEVGHPVTRGAIYYMLKKHGWRKVMPRGKHPKQANEEAVQAYKKNHNGNPNPPKREAETASDVPGRGWIWTDQQA